jgi:hypothetical protein
MLQVPKASGSCIPPPKPPAPHQAKGPGRPLNSTALARARGGGAYRCYLIVTEQAGGDLQGEILQREKFAEGEVCSGEQIYRFGGVPGVAGAGFPWDAGQYMAPSQGR